jgi:hypothetical protein
MNMVIPDDGAVLWLTWSFGVNPASAEDFVVKLFSNDIDVDTGTVTGDFTEASFTGYSGVAVTRASFTSITAEDGIGTAESTVSPFFQNTGVDFEVVYGWYLVGATSDVTLACANFNAAINVTPSTAVSLGNVTILQGQYP